MARIREQDGHVIILPDEFVRRHMADGRISDEPPKGVCPECWGSGYVKDYADATEFYGEWHGGTNWVEYAKKCLSCNGGHERIVQHVRKRANIPAAFYDSGYVSFKWDIYKDRDGNAIDTLGQKKIADSFILDYQEWVEKRKGLYIYSRTRGSGKTFLASCICNELMRKYEVVTKFVSVSNLLNLSQSGNKNALDAYERDPISLLCECKLLVLDDLGQKNTGNEWLTDVLFRILDERMQRGLQVVITANMPLKEIRFDDRIADRLNLMVQPIPLPECSIRAKEAYQEKKELLKGLGLM